MGFGLDAVGPQDRTVGGQVTGVTTDAQMQRRRASLRAAGFLSSQERARDVTGMAYAIVEYASDPARARSHGLAGREWVRKHYAQSDHIRVLQARLFSAAVG